jgi:hypothetical protein
MICWLAVMKFKICCIYVCCLLFVVYCLLFIVCCLLFVVYCLLFIVCCLLFIVCCLLFVVYCLLFIFCCLLLCLEAPSIPKGEVVWRLFCSKGSRCLMCSKGWRLEQIEHFELFKHFELTSLSN